MKKLAFAASALTVAAALPLMSCSGSEEKKDEAANETPKSAKVEGDTFAPTTNIRYYNMDSVMANYDLVKTYNETNLRATRELENAMQSRQGELQRLASNIQQKVQSNGYLSEASYNADMTELTGRRPILPREPPGPRPAGSSPPAAGIHRLHKQLPRLLQPGQALRRHPALLPRPVLQPGS